MAQRGWMRAGAWNQRQRKKSSEPTLFQSLHVRMMACPNPIKYQS